MTLRVLALEDSVTRQRVLQIALVATAELHAFAEAEAAYEAALTLRPDVVLATCADAPADGYALCARLRSDARTASLPVLLLTTAQRPYDVARGAEVAATGHIERPCSAQALLEAVRAATPGADARSAPHTASAPLQRPAQQGTRPQPPSHAHPSPQTADAAKALPYPAASAAPHPAPNYRTDDTAQLPGPPAAPPARAACGDESGGPSTAARPLPPTSFSQPPPAQAREASPPNAWPTTPPKRGVPCRRCPTGMPLPSRPRWPPAWATPSPPCSAAWPPNSTAPPSTPTCARWWSARSWPSSGRWSPNSPNATSSPPRPAPPGKTVPLPRARS